MPRRTEIPFAEVLTATGENAPSLEEKLQHLQAIRSASKTLGSEADRFLIERMTHLHEGLEKAQSHLDKLRGVVEKLSAPPWHSAIFMGLVQTSQGMRAVVAHQHEALAKIDRVELGEAAADIEPILDEHGDARL